MGIIQDSEALQQRTVTKEEWKIDSDWTYAGLEQFVKAYPGTIIINMPVDVFALGHAGAIVLAEAVGAEKALERANLIAAAPDLLEALEMLMGNPHLDLGDLIYKVRDAEGRGWDGPSVTAWSNALEKSKAAIAKAKGQS